MIEEHCYTQDGSNPPIPLKRITLKNIKTSVTTTGLALLDTGADCSLVSFNILMRLNVRRINDNLETIKIAGIGQQAIDCIKYRIGINFYHDIFINTIVYGCLPDAIDTDIIIGRNLLNRYDVCFHGKNKIFTITP